MILIDNQCKSKFMLKHKMLVNILRLDKSASNMLPAIADPKIVIT